MSLTAPEASHEQYVTDDGLMTESAAPEEDLVQQQQSIPAIQTPAQPSSDHLMALLGQPLPAAPHQQSYNVTTPADDGAADRLKHLLRVDQAQGMMQSQQNGAPQPTNPNAVDLLAMLRQGSTSLAPPTQAAARPRTPLDQVTNTAYEPRKPSAHRTRPSEALPLRGPPPDFAFSPARMAQQQQYQNSGSPTGRPPPMWQAPQVEQPPKPYERIGDPQFARENNPLASGPMAPAASQLPAPKLSSHHMNLLDAFKSGAKPNPSHAVPSQQAPQHAWTQPATNQNSLLALFKGNTPQQPATSTAVQESRARQAFTQVQANTVSAPSHPLQPQLDATLSVPRPNTHKDSLLSLFRTPSANAPQVVEVSDRAPQAQAVQAEPAPAQTPTSKPGSVQILSRKERLSNENKSPVRFDALPNAATPAAASSSSKKADLLSTPDTGTVRRKPRAKSPAIESPGMSDSSIGNAATVRKMKRNARSNVEKPAIEQRPTPTQILKRPTPAASQLQTPEQSPEKESVKPVVAKADSKPVTSTAKPKTMQAETKPTTPKPFQPQILRRPQQASPAAPLELPTSITPNDAPSVPAVVSATNKTEDLMSLFKQTSLDEQAKQPPAMPAPSVQQAPAPAGDQQNTLLSLFAKPTTPASAMGPPKKPMSPPAVRPQPLNRPPSTRTDHQASLLSLFGPPKPAPMSELTVASPTSIVSFGSNARSGTPGGTVDGLKRGSISFVMSGQGEVRPRINSMTSRDGIGSGAHTPISTTDRGFLLNYLKGI